MLITVLGASGNIGSKLATMLLQAGHKVRAVGRDAQKLSALEQAGAELAIGNLEDVAFVASVFTGADAAFVMIPPNMIAEDNLAYQNLVGDNIAIALKNASLQFVVNLSSFGADLGDKKIGPIKGVHLQELRLQEINNVKIVHLRPGYFFENTFANLPTIKEQGAVYNPLPADLKFPAIATYDIAVAAFEAFKNHEAHSHQEIITLLGDREYTMNELAQIMGKALGKDEVNYIQIPDDAFYGALIGFGMSPSLAGLYKEMMQGMKEENIFEVKERTAANTTATSYEAWIGMVFGGPKA